MRTLTYQLRDLKKAMICIGFEDENNRTQVKIDCAEVFSEYPGAAVTMKVQAPKGGIYPATVTRDGDMILWTVRDCDVANKGSGEFQLTFTDRTTVIKTCVGRFHVDRSLKGSGTAPSGVQDWLDHAEDVLEQVESAEIHQPMIGLDGYWYKWNQEAGEYVSTGTKAQGQDGQPGQDGQDGTDATPDLIAKDYADLSFPVAKDSFCYHDGKLYQAKQAIQTAEDWTAAHWQETTVEEKITDIKNAIQLTSDFVGDPDTDIGHHSEPITTDIINMTPGTSTEHDVTFTLTKEKIKVNGTADANFYKDLQSVTLEAGKTYTLTIGSPITIDGFFIMLYQGSTVLANFKKANGNYTYTVTPVSDISAVLKAYCAKTYNLNNYEKTISLTVSGTQNVGNTVAEAVHNLRSDKTYYVDASGAEMLVMCKMPGASNKDVGVKMKTFTNNNTYSFCSFGTVDNDTPYVSDDPSDYVEYQSTGEDWFSPCKVYADNDADGDYPAATNFSGGFHRIDSKDTSRRISLDILIDGKDQPGFVGYCNTIDITVVHQLVASNTFKTDGTGREVLKETVKMHFENGRIDVETTFEALEAVTLKVWYFIQGHHKADGLGSDGVRYIGSDANRGITSMDENSNAGDLYGRVMRFLSDTLQMDMEIKDFDAGRFNHNTQSSSGFVSFYTTYSKAYFNAVNDTTTGVSLAEGDTITARGSYRFGMFE